MVTIIGKHRAVLSGPVGIVTAVPPPIALVIINHRQPKHAATAARGEPGLGRIA